MQIIDQLFIILKKISFSIFFKFKFFKFKFFLIQIFFKNFFLFNGSKIVENSYKIYF